MHLSASLPIAMFAAIAAAHKSYHAHPVSNFSMGHSDIEMTTSTVYSYDTVSVTYCPPGVTVCPSGSVHVITTSVPISVTTCPLSGVGISHTAIETYGISSVSESEYPHSTIETDSVRTHGTSSYPSSIKDGSHVTNTYGVPSSVSESEYLHSSIETGVRAHGTSSCPSSLKDGSHATNTYGVPSSVSESKYPHSSTEIEGPSSVSDILTPNNATSSCPSSLKDGNHATSTYAVSSMTKDETAHITGTYSIASEMYSKSLSSEVETSVYVDTIISTYVRGYGDSATVTKKFLKTYTTTITRTVYAVRTGTNAPTGTGAQNYPDPSESAVDYDGVPVNGDAVSVYTNGGSNEDRVKYVTVYPYPADRTNDVDVSRASATAGDAAHGSNGHRGDRHRDCSPVYVTVTEIETVTVTAPARKTEHEMHIADATLSQYSSLYGNSTISKSDCTLRQPMTMATGYLSYIH